MISKRPIGIWLLICAFMVMAMATIGAITRLTESGLSIVEWKPVTGAVPPMNDVAWQTEFDLYKSSPQYVKVNQGMTLDDFKKIYFWEWLHRLWGRLIGVVFAVPLAWFWFRRRLDRNLKRHSLGLLALGFLQGFMGWYMVKSGLIDRPEVSHYRLAAHLFLAVILYGWFLALALKVLRPEKSAVLNIKAASLYKHGLWTLGILAVTIIWGAFVAGKDAGLIYNTFPLMDGHVMPPEAWFLKPAILNLVENHATIQWFHRVLAFLVGLMAIGFGARCLALQLPAISRQLAVAVMIMVIVQITLGAVTVITQVQLHPAVTHQFGAFILAGIMIWALYELRKVLRIDVVV